MEDKKIKDLSLQSEKLLLEDAISNLKVQIIDHQEEIYQLKDIGLALEESINHEKLEKGLVPFDNFLFILLHLLNSFSSIAEAR